MNKEREKLIEVLVDMAKRVYNYSVNGGHQNQVEEMNMLAEVGRQLFNIDAAEEKLNKYWLVNHNADTTETGLPMNRTYIKTIWDGHPAQQSSEKAIVETFCFERYGPKVDYVQGVAPVPSWSLSSITKDKWKEASPIIWGGRSTRTIQLVLSIGNRMAVNTLMEKEV